MLVFVSVKLSPCILMYAVCPPTDRTVTMNTKLMFIGAIIFSVLALKTEDLLFGFLAVYLTCLAISVFVFKHEQKQNAKRKGDNSLLLETNLQDKRHQPGLKSDNTVTMT